MIVIVHHHMIETWSYGNDHNEHREFIDNLVSQLDKNGPRTLFLSDCYTSLHNLHSVGALVDFDKFTYCLGIVKSRVVLRVPGPCFI